MRKGKPSTEKPTPNSKKKRLVKFKTNKSASTKTRSTKNEAQQGKWELNRGIERERDKQREGVPGRAQEGCVQWIHWCCDNR